MFFWHRQILYIKGKLSNLLSHKSHGSSRCDRPAACGLRRCVEQVDNTVRLSYTPEVVFRNDFTLPLRAATRRIELSQCRDPDGLVNIRASFGRGIGEKQRPVARQGLCNGCQRRSVHKIKKMQPNNGSYALWCTSWIRNGRTSVAEVTNVDFLLGSYSKAKASRWHWHSDRDSGSVCCAPCRLPSFWRPVR